MTIFLVKYGYHLVAAIKSKANINLNLDHLGMHACIQLAPKSFYFSVLQCMFMIISVAVVVGHKTCNDYIIDNH